MSIHEVTFGLAAISLTLLLADAVQSNEPWLWSSGLINGGDPVLSSGTKILRTEGSGAVVQVSRGRDGEGEEIGHGSWLVEFEERAPSDTFTLHLTALSKGTQPSDDVIVSAAPPNVGQKPGRQGFTVQATRANDGTPLDCEFFYSVAL